LRKSKSWEHCDAVLDLHGKPGYEMKSFPRVMLRYALQCPQPRAKSFVADLRARDPKLVAEALELLELEK
jgi:hypothetical protein